MSTRSATNKRTQNREYTGAARKSAASAKPAREAAGSVRVVPASSKARRAQRERGESLEGMSREEKRARKRELRAREDRVYSVSNSMLKQDPEYKKRRAIFWVILGLALAILLMVWLMLFGMDGAQDVATIPQIVGVVVAYVAVFGAFIFDFVRIRPLRNYYRGQAEGMSDKKIFEYIERAAAEEEASRSRKKSKAAKDEEPAVQDAPAEAEPAAKKRPKKNNRSRR